MPPWETAGVDRDKMQRAFDASFDQAIVFHAYTDYMRDYAVYTYNVADPATGIRPSFVRWLFTCCVQATATTALLVQRLASSPQRLASTTETTEPAAVAAVEALVNH